MEISNKKLYLETRKNLIASQFSSLNDKQREAVLATEGALLILAGAGSGKTTVLISRIANLIRFGNASDSDEIADWATDNDIDVMKTVSDQSLAIAACRPVEPWRILAITFTNKAADELKNRLTAMLGEKAQNIWASTFHSCCVRILRRDAVKIGFPENFTIYDSSDSQSLIKQIIKDFDIDDKTFPPRMILSEISKAKDSRIDSKTYLDSWKEKRDIWHVTIGQVYVEYMKRMFAAGAMDFDDLILFAVKLLDEHEDVREYWQNKFKYVMIDEYQDTNNLQYQLASLLSGKWNNICVVGDDDQSIYKFRGATIENILSFEDQHKNCRTIRLEQNYRSKSHILDAANALIKNNKGRKGKNLWTNQEAGEVITLFTASNQDEEAQYIAAQIMASYRRGSKWNEHAILYRMNAQSNNMERAFKKNGIPYRIIGGTRFFDRAEIKDILAYMCVISSTSDDLRLTRIINVPARGIGNKTVDTVQKLAQEENLSMYDVLYNAGKYPELLRSATKLKLFAIMIEELKTFAKEHTPDELFDEIISKTGYIKALEDKNTVEDTARVENIKELKSSIVGYMKESEDSTLEGFLADVALYTDIDNYDNDADSVVMMTMHSAKGLEFPNVFIIGAEEGIFPGQKSIGEQDEMEEERRLCYVAVTRAKEKLFITCAKHRMLFGHTTSNSLSRFVEEIPEEHIEKKETNRNFEETDAYNREERYLKSGYNSSFGYGSYGGGYNKRKVVKEKPVSAPSAKKSVPLPEFSIGDSVDHKAFGNGVIISMKPMGNDSLIEIEFEGIGTKKLMLRAASQHMKKI